MLDSASFIGAALQGNAGHEGWSGFVDVVTYPTWPIGVVANAPGWAGGGWCVLFSSVWSAGVAIGLPFLGLWCGVGLLGEE